MIPAVDFCGICADADSKEKHIVSPKLIAYIKRLIYTAALKDPRSKGQYIFVSISTGRTPLLQIARKEEEIFP